jgi:ribosomal protein S18 acetylase RimI-like enzyme
MADAEGEPCVILRKATEDDLDDLAQMALELQGHVESSNPKIWRMSEVGSQSTKAEMIDALHDPDVMIVVASNKEEELLGMAMGRILRKDKMTIKIAGSIERIIVSGKWRGRGIGTRLVDALSDFFEEKGVKDITLRYVFGNVEGEAFWRGLGFEPRIAIANVKPERLREELRKRMQTA